MGGLKGFVRASDSRGFGLRALGFSGIGFRGFIGFSDLGFIGFRCLGFRVKCCLFRAEGFYEGAKVRICCGFIRVYSGI